MKNKFCFANLRLSRRHSVPILISAVFACALMQSKVQAQSILWNGNLAAGPHVWNTSTNWTGSNVPDDFPGPGIESGNLARDWTAAATINFSGNTTINGVTYDDTGATADVAMILASLPTTAVVTLAGTTPTVGVTGTLSINSPLAGTTAWRKTGSGVLVLNGANTFNANLEVSDGTLRAATVATSLGAGGNILVSNVVPASANDTNALELAGGFTFGAGRTLTLRSASGAFQGRTSLINQAGNNTWAGPIVLESPLNQALQSSAGILTITGNITNGTPATTQMFFRGAGAGVLTGTMDLGSAVPFKTDAGTWTINSTNNVHGNLGIANGGITVNNNNALDPRINLTFGENNANTGTLTLNAGFTQALRDLSISAPSTSTNGHRIIGAGTLDLGWPSRTLNVVEMPAANDLTISTAVIGVGGFTKTGPGRLLVNGPSVQGPVAVNAGSLAASGAFSGGITVAGGTTLIPGNLVAAGTLTTPRLAFGNGTTTLQMDVGATTSDLIQVTTAGGFTQAGATTVEISPAGGFTVAVYPLISYLGTSPGLGGFSLGPLPDGITANLVDTGSAIALNVTAVQRLAWTGAADSTWDNLALNWNKISGPSGVAFVSGNEVGFGDGPTNTAIALTGTVDPSRVVFSNTLATPYTLASGTLSGSGAMDLVKTGNGVLTLTNANTYSGLTDIRAGTLELDFDGGTLTASSGVVVGPTAIFRVSDDDGDFTMSRPLGGSGTVRVNPNTLAGTPAARSATFNGIANGFSGNIILESPASGSTRLAASAAAIGAATLTVENENQFFGSTGNTYANNITLTGDGFNDSSSSIGALRLDGGTWNGTIAVTGTAGDSGGSVYDARIGSNGGTVALNGSISGGDLSIWSFNIAATTMRLAAANSFGDLIIGGLNPGSGTGGGQSAIILGDNQSVPANTTATLGTGDVYLVSGTNATNPMDSILRINRADGYTLGTGQDIIGTGAGTLQWGGVQLHVDTPASGFSTGANSITLSDGTNGGLIRVSALTPDSIFNIGTGATVATGSFHIGDSDGRNGTVNQTGGALTTINQLRVGHFPNETATYNLSAGSVLISGPSAATSPSGTAEQNGGIYVGVDGQGVINQTGGIVTTNWVVLDNRANNGAGTNMTGIDQYNLALGTLALKSTWGVIQRNVSTEFNFSGGLITIDNSGTGTGTGVDITVPLDTILTVSGSAATLDTNGGGNSFRLLRNINGPGTLNLAGGGNINLDPAAGTTSTINVVLAGTLNPVLKIGTGTTTLAAGNTYSGATTVAAGTLNVAGGLINSAVSVLDGATLGGEGFAKSLTLGSLTGGNLLINGGTSGAFNVLGNLVLNGVTTVDFAGTPAGNTVNVLTYGGTSTGSGTFALANAANYRSSSFTSSPGAVVLNLDLKNLTWTGTDGVSPTAWNINGAENWTDGVARKFFNGDSVTFNDTPAVNQTVNITGNVQPKTVTVNNSVIDYTISGTAGNGIGGSASLTKSGIGTLTLSSPNTLTGPILVTGGVLKPANAAAFGSSSGITVGAGGQINLNGTNFTNTRSYSYTIAGTGPDGRGALVNEVANIASNAAVTRLTLSGNASVGTYGGTGDGNRFDIGFNGTDFGSIDGGGFTLTKTGDAMVNLRAAASNITYVVQQGTLRGENSPLALGTNPVTVSGGRLDSWGNLSWAVPLTMATGTSLTSSSGTAIWTGGIGITGDVTFGGGAVTNVASAISGTGSLIKADAGRVILSAANTYGGTTTVAAGFLQANIAGAFNTGPVQVTNSVAAGSLVVNGGVTLANNVVVGSGPTIPGTAGRGLLESTGTGQGVFNGTITLNSAPTGGGTFLGGAAIGNELVFAGQVNTTGGVQFSQRDGRVVFSGGGTATGSTFITTGVTTLGASEGMPSGVILNPGGSGAATFEMAGFNQTLAGLVRNTGQATTVTNSSLVLSTLTLAVAGSTSYSGLLAGNLELVKTGAGTQELSAPNNSYTGGTTVSAGTLRVSNLSGSATGSGPVTVGIGGTVAGIGIISGDVVVSGQVTPGVTTGSLTMTGNVAFNPGSTLRIDLNDASSPKSDQLGVAGTLTATAATLDFDTTGTPAEPVYVVAVYSGSAPSGFTATDVPAGYSVDYNYNGNSIALVSPYGSWAAEQGLTSGVNNGKLQDPDNDGIPNVLEFATDGDPLDGAASGKIRTIITDVNPGAPVVNALTITLPVRAGAVFSGPGDQVSAAVDGIVYRIQASGNLTDFTSPNVTEVTDNAAILAQLGLPALSGAGWTYRTFRAPGDPAVAGREFLRVVAE